jgi:amino acid permease
VILSIMPILMLRSARKNGDIVPAWQCGWIAHPLIQVMVVILYLCSMAYAIASALGWLPGGW